MHFTFVVHRKKSLVSAFVEVSMRLFDNLESGKRDSCMKGLNPRGVRLPYKRLMGMCHWMGSHFPDWSDYNGVASSTELLE